VETLSGDRASAFGAGTSMAYAFLIAVVCVGPGGDFCVRFIFAPASHSATSRIARTTPSAPGNIDTPSMPSYETKRSSRGPPMAVASDGGGGGSPQ
jgi:hypothetical protein